MTATTRPATDQPAVRLPTWRLFAAVIVASALAAAAWIGLATLIGGSRLDSDLAVPALIIVVLCTVVAVIAIQPWKPRPVSLWITMWLGQTVLRLTITPVAAFIAARVWSFDVMALAVPLGITYLAAVVCEALVVARFLKDPGAA
jgi:hypothetical protein